MKLVTAIVRITALDDVVKALGQAGIKGMTISEIKGLGEGFQLNNIYTIHGKIEIIVPDDIAEKAVAVILDHGRIGMPGDGVLTVASLDYAVKMRTKEKLK